MESSPLLQGRRAAEPREALPVLPGTDLERFVAVSVALTGFNSVELRGTGMTAIYLATVEKWIGPNILAELLRFGTEPPPDEETTRVLIMANPKLGPVALNVITLWYTGTWNPLTVAWYVEWQNEIPDPPNLGTALQPYVVTPQAYVESLIWVAAGTHPMGAKQPGFGTWADPPKKETR